MPGKDVLTAFWNTRAEVVCALVAHCALCDECLWQGDEWFMIESTEQMNTMASGLHSQLHSKATVSSCRCMFSLVAVQS